MDFGNCVHILDPENPDYESRLLQTPWIRPTVEEPDEMWHLVLQRRGRLPVPRVYFIRQLRAHRVDVALSFVVITQPIGNVLRLKTWFDEDDDYLESRIREAGDRL